MNPLLLQNEGLSRLPPRIGSSQKQYSAQVVEGASIVRNPTDNRLTVDDSNFQIRCASQVTPGVLHPKRTMKYSIRREEVDV